jgi:2-polyprenyl-6-methoxyphenol hydroxylase-like FAD-dependent oxidoreductase
MNDHPMLIVGGGIGGLTAALCLHRAGVEVEVYESVAEVRPLGVGINVQPSAVRVLHELGLAPALASSAIETAELVYVNKFGQRIWQEPRGRAAGYAVPQYSVHRGELQVILHRAALATLPEGSVRTGHTFERLECTNDGVQAWFRDRASGDLVATRGDALVGADGIHSAVRRLYYPDEGPPRFAGRMLWRATAEAPPFLTGRSMVWAGHDRQKIVCYPISERHRREGRAVLNWIAELQVPLDTVPPRTDWNRRVDKAVFEAPFLAWDFGWLNVPKLIAEAEAVYEFPMVDRDPLPRWTHGRVTLLGDAAHPMVPVGSNGASQAILDALLLLQLGLAAKGSPEAKIRNAITTLECRVPVVPDLSTFAGLKTLKLSFNGSFRGEDLAGLGDGVEAPRQFSGANVECADRTWSRRGRAFAQAHAHDEEVFEDDPGCRRLKGQARRIAPEFLFQVDGTLLTKTRNASPGHHIDGVQEVVVGVKDAPVRALGPIGQAAIDPTLGDAFARSGVEAPFLDPGGRVEREEFQVGCRAIDHAIDHQWIALNLRTVLRIRPPTAIGPGNLQLPDILGLDLLQARMVAAARVTQVDGPVHGARRGPRSAEGQHRRRPAPCHPSSLLLLHAKSIQSIVPEPRRTAIEHEPVAATPVRGLARQGRRHRGNRPRKIRIHGQLHPGETIGWLCGGVEQ